MKILLIRPPLISFRKNPGAVLTEPLALMYLAGFLKRHGKTVRILDAAVGGAVSREETILEIVNRRKKRAACSDIDGSVVRLDGRVKVNPRRRNFFASLTSNRLHNYF